MTSSAVELPLFNRQPAEKRAPPRDDGALEVFSIFGTIQGEGPFSGRVAVFVRTAGCDLQCPLCDTDYTSRRVFYTPAQLVHSVQEADPRRGAALGKRGLVVLTGGEPFRQRCGPAVGAFLRAGYEVQVETNGTLADHSSGPFCRGGGLTVVCSPKTGSVAKEVEPVVDHLKYVVSAGAVDPGDGLPLDSLGTGVKPARPWGGFTGNVYLQPCDDRDPERNRENVKAAVESCMKFGYLLCLQTHKLVGLP